MRCYSANGNTFLIVDNTNNTISEEEKPDFVKKHVGELDGVIFVEKADSKFFMDYYNRDGSMATFCGNGARAFSKYLMDMGLINVKKFTFLSRAGEIRVLVEDGIWVRMPKVSEKKRLAIDDYSGYLVVVGVPHFVIRMKNVDEIDVEKLGKYLRSKTGANVDFYQVFPDFLKVRTYERGVERETKACGTGITSVFVVHRDETGMKMMKVQVPGGILYVKEENGEIFLKGDVRVCSEE
ncbi:diaminopimelate epimerase [Thermotoga sp. KOL6]|uniref:diaminopimelate epimerase n=1 Tax=Thermotoga sp. KOL6 TaxID=126741 RepID=UPI000C772166|nr:diaminopimelate epimerase [Thermotoga sp. KOL6]PLV60251.1 diaminopimelate epimerase [Thermotoga sp. KOL6]